MKLAIKPRLTVQWLQYTDSAEEDPYGGSVPGYLPPVDLKVYAAAPTSVDELPGPLTDSMADRVTLYVPSNFPNVDRRDRIVYRGNEYEVDGGVMSYDDGPFGFEPGGTLNLKRVS